MPISIVASDEALLSDWVAIEIAILQIVTVHEPISLTIDGAHQGLRQRGAG